MMNQQPMMANFNAPAFTGAMMNNMMTGGRPPANGGQQRSGAGGPYGVIYDAVEKAKRQGGYYDTDMGLIMDELNRQDEAEENVNDVIDDLQYHYTVGTWGGTRPIDDLFGITTKPPHDPESVYLPWMRPGYEPIKRMPTHRNPLAK